MKYILLITTIFIFSVSCTKKQVPQNDGVASDTTAIENGQSDDVKYCTDLVKEILKSSQRYKVITAGLHDDVVANGGTSFGVTLESSPSPKIDKAMAYSENYNINIHEIYPDHLVVVSRFTFNPKDKNLYMHDDISESLKPISFDLDLLKKSSQFCE